MDEHFNKWKLNNKDFCEKATTSETQILYLTERIVNELDAFREKLLNLDKEYQETDINRIINKLSSIRTFIRHSKGKPSKF